MTDPVRDDASRVLLEAEGLSRHFGGVPAVQEVTFEVERGEVVGVIGPNGSGKTTLLNLLSGFVAPDAGSIRWEGTSLRSMSTNRRARRGLVRTFQDRMVFPALTVGENLMIATESRSSSQSGPEACRRLADYVGVADLLGRTASDISWGQARLVGLALCLATNPKMLLIDEPFAGLSPASAADVSNVIKAMKADDQTMLVVDHEMNYLLPLCDRLIVLQAGQKIADGEPAAVLGDPIVRRAYFGGSHA